MITQVIHHLSQIVSSEIISITRMNDNNKKMNTSYHHFFFFFFFLKLWKNQYWWRFHINHRMSSLLNDSCQSSVNSPIKSFKWPLSRSLRNLKVCFLWKIKTLTQRAKFIKERVFVMKHILVKLLGMLTFDGMSMKTYVRNLNLQSI